MKRIERLSHSGGLDEIRPESELPEV